MQPEMGLFPEYSILWEIYLILTVVNSDFTMPCKNHSSSLVICCWNLLLFGQLSQRRLKFIFWYKRCLRSVCTSEENNTSVVFCRACAPVFLGFLKRKTGRCPPPAPPITASLILSAKFMIHWENPAKILVWVAHFPSKYSELFIVFRDQRIQGEWGLWRAGERRGKKVPHPPSPVLTLHSPHSWAAA